MSAPANQVFVQGITQVSADNLNTFLQSAQLASNLQSFIGTQGMMCYLQGLNAPGDGGQGPFFWNASGTANDGINNFAPSGAAVGCWTRLPTGAIIPYSYQVALTGFAITIPNGVNALVLNPAGTLATGGITMPSAPVGGQTVKMSSTQIVTTLTVSANAGQSIDNAPTAFAAGTPVGFIYVAASATWFRI